VVQISALLVDLGRVLVDFDMAGCEAVLASRSRVGAEALMRILWDTGRARSYERGEVTASQFHAYLVEDAGLEMGFEEFMTCWTEVFDPDPILPPHVLPELASRFPMTLVSNTNEAHADFVRRNYDFFPYFTNLVFSYEVGALKPDARIFERAIAVAGYPAGNLLFIDDRSENIAAAAGLGLQTHQFRSVTGLCDLFAGLGVPLDGRSATGDP
jgi:putative hydrolase of the HAD superfamily